MFPTKKIHLPGLLAPILACLFGLTACLPPQTGEVNHLALVDKGKSYLDQVSYRPTEAKYFDLIQQTLALNSAEQDLLAKNGFVVSDRLTFDDFTTAYAQIYQQDLPVLITTDSILQAVHHLYDDLLLRLDESMFSPKLNTLLSQTYRQLQIDAQTNSNSELASLYTDLDLYLAVPLALLSDTPSSTPGVAHYVELIQAAHGPAEVDLFGGRRLVDFSLFKARGHYTKSVALTRYFQAISWLALIDFCLVEYNPTTGQPQIHLEQITAAALLNQVMTKAGQRPAWDEFETLLGAFTGRGDNMTLSDLDRFLIDARIETPTKLLHYPAPQQLLLRLTGGDYGQQRIVAQIQTVDPTLPQPVSLMLLGQRFSVDSYVMSNLVYDRLTVDGRKVERRLPSPLDVMSALGNDRATAHLQSELTSYGYQDNLAVLRHEIESYEPAFWTSSAYNRWLNALRQLDNDTTGPAYPQAMRTSAWADKMLHTQLASWTQLRHDNILYTKESFSSNLCNYPAGYVEPYPRFYAAVHDYAEAQQLLLDRLDLARLTKDQETIRQTAAAKFGQLAAAAAQLQIMAEKELRLEPFSPVEEKFLKETAVHKSAVFYEPQWAGWYPELFLEYNLAMSQVDRKDKSPAMIADIHTDPNQPSRILHVATGPVAALIFIADTNEGPTMYVGPSFTYFEVIETGRLPHRLTDQEWQEQLSPLAAIHPATPAWTLSFRLPLELAPLDPWWWRSGIIGLVAVGVYGVGIYSHRRWLLWLGLAIGIVLGLWLLSLGIQGSLNMMNFKVTQVTRQLLGDRPFDKVFDYDNWLSYKHNQQVARFIFGGLTSLAVSLLVLVKNLNWDKLALYRHGERMIVGIIISSIILAIMWNQFSENMILILPGLIYCGFGMLLWLLLCNGVGYLINHVAKKVTHPVASHLLSTIPMRRRIKEIKNEAIQNFETDWGARGESPRIPPGFSRIPKILNVPIKKLLALYRHGERIGIGIIISLAILAVVYSLYSETRSIIYTLLIGLGFGMLWLLLYYGIGYLIERIGGSVLGGDRKVVYLITSYFPWLLHERQKTKEITTEKLIE